MMGYEKGSVIINSKPFAYVICNSERESRCEACLQRNTDLRRCKNCLFAKYCNGNCQKQGWNLHKLECKHLRKVVPKVPSETARLMALIILKIKFKNGHDEEERIADVTRKYSCLVDHVEDVKKDKERCDHFISLCHVLEEYLGKELLPPASELLSHFGKITVNCFSITDGEMQAIGVGMYLGPSGLDHSCQPNATAVFYGPQMHVRALENIPHSDITKIYFSYIDIFASSSARIEQLRKQYYFTCECPLCNDTERDISMNYVKCGKLSCNHPIRSTDKVCKCGHEVDMAAVKKVKDSLDELFVTIKDSKDSEEENQMILKLCQTALPDCSIHLHELNSQLVKLYDTAMDACIELEMWELALQYGQNTLEAYRLYYGPKHPILGIQLLKLGKIQCYIGDTNASRTLTEVSDVIKLTHGQQHPMFAVARELLDNLKYANNRFSLKKGSNKSEYL